MEEYRLITQFHSLHHRLSYCEVFACEGGARRERGAGGGCRIRSIPPRKYQPGAAALRSPPCHPFLSAFSPGSYREQRSGTAPKQRRCSTSNSHLFLSRCARLACSQSTGATINNQLAHCNSTSNSLPSSRPGQLCQ